MKLIEKIFTLKSIEPFNLLSDREVIIVANIIEVKSYTTGEIIYNSESILKKLYIIVKGVVRLGDTNIIKPYFGLEMLINKTIEKNIIASTDVTVFMLSHEHILTLLYESPHLMMGFLKSQEEEIDEIKI